MLCNVSWGKEKNKNNGKNNSLLTMCLAVAVHQTTIGWSKQSENNMLNYTPRFSLRNAENEQIKNKSLT